MAKNTPKFYDPALWIQLGFNPKTGLPLKYDPNTPNFQPHNMALLAEKDRADALNRFTWSGLPEGITGEMIERILYFRGQGAFFYMKENNKFYFLPYAMAGGENAAQIDCYGRFTNITPLTFNGSFEDDPKAFVNGLTKKVQYDIKLDTITLDDFDNSAVLLHDRSLGLSQITTPRASLNAPLLELMSTIPCYMNTALQMATGIQGVRVEHEQDAANVMASVQAVRQAALCGQWAVPVVGSMDFQQLNGTPTANMEEYLLTLQALDDYRLSMYGIPANSVFQKKAHMLESEQQANTGTAELVLQDDLRQRQYFCDVINSLWGLSANCDINESLTNMDRDMDGDAYSDMDPATEEAAMTNEEDTANDTE